MQQKVVPVPAMLTANVEEIDKMVAVAIKHQNSVGFRFVGQIQANYWEKPGCIGGLFGQKPLERQRVLLVFDPE